MRSISVRSRRGRLLWGVLVACLLFDVSSCESRLTAQEAAPSAADQVQLFFRTLRFDEAFNERGPLRVAVLHDQDSDDAEAVRAAFEELGVDGFRGLPVSAISVPFRNSGELLRLIDVESITAIYVPERLTPALLSILQVTRGLRVPTLTNGRRMVERGVSIGVTTSESGSRPVVNYRASLLEGLRLSARLLRLAEVIR